MRRRLDGPAQPSRPPLASTISATSSPASSRSWRRLGDPGSMFAPQSWPILIFIAVHPAARQVVDLFAELVFVQRGEAARAVDRHRRSGLWPSSADSGSSRSWALRSHRAISTALSACMTSPRVPMLRQLRCIASQAPAMSKASRPVTTRGKLLGDDGGRRRGAVGPSQSGGPAGMACTTTAVVASQCRVPSASGSGVSTVYAVDVDPVDGWRRSWRTADSSRCAVRPAAWSVIKSAARAASAMMVSAGLAEPWVGMVLPSTT